MVVCSVPEIGVLYASVRELTVVDEMLGYEVGREEGASVMFCSFRL